MSGRAFDSRFLFAWPQSQTSVMGAEQAANTLADVKVRQLAKQGKKLSQADIDAIRDPVLGEFKRKQSAYWSTSEIWDDGIIDPVDTRNALGMAIRSEEHTSELQSLMRISYAVFCLKKKKKSSTTKQILIKLLYKQLITIKTYLKKLY